MKRRKFRILSDVNARLIITTLHRVRQDRTTRAVAPPTLRCTGGPHQKAMLFYAGLVPRGDGGAAERGRRRELRTGDQEWHGGRWLGTGPLSGGRRHPRRA